MVVAGALLGGADLAAVDARLTLERWRAESRRGRDEWHAVDGRLRLARRLAPGDAGFESRTAELLAWWVLGVPAAAPARRAAIERAREHQLRALGIRPTWGHGWARLAEIEYLAGSPVERVAGLLERAMTLAPWEPGVQLAVNRLAMAVWDELPETARTAVERNVVRAAAIDGDFDALAVVALHHGRLEWLERRVAGFPERVRGIQTLRHRARR